jgi:hypothetical protein
MHPHGISIDPIKRSGARGSSQMANSKKKGFIRAFLDFFVLFSGVSTASALARTQGRRPSTRGVFLFRRRKDSSAEPAVPAAPTIDDTPRK